MLIRYITIIAEYVYPLMGIRHKVQGTSDEGDAYFAKNTEVNVKCSINNAQLSMLNCSP
jgi:hypothetical protein